MLTERDQPADAKIANRSAHRNHQLRFSAEGRPVNPKWFGDSYDIVKRFFVGVLNDLGCRVYVDPMCTVDWKGIENQFHQFLGTVSIQDYVSEGERTVFRLAQREVSKHRRVVPIRRKRCRKSLASSRTESLRRGTR